MITLKDFLEITGEDTQIELIDSETGNAINTDATNSIMALLDGVITKITAFGEVSITVKFLDNKEIEV